MMLLFLLLIVAVVVLLLQSRSSQAIAGGRRRDDAQAVRRWQSVRRVAEEDVTQLGQQIAATPVPQSMDADAARDFEDALAAYERAKEALASSAHPDDLQWVSRSLDDGRFALARLEARAAGRELPTRRPPCFFDQRHGLSVADAQWAPPGGALRDVPVCAACQARLADGLDPETRTVETASGRRPYYDAGPEFGPWARGWYAASGAYMLGNMLIGTMLLNSLFLPPGFDYFAPELGGDGSMGGEAGGDAGSGGDAAGGDVGDVGAGDFGSFGDFGGGDFGGF